MRTVRVQTNRVCNQNCVYCLERSDADPRAFVRRDAVEQRIKQSLVAGVRELVLTGGEPTLRNDLEALIAFARGLSVQVTLETNATVVDAARAQSLARAGLSRVRVNLSGWGHALDEVTRDPGGFEATLRGIEAFADAGILVDAVAVLIRPTTLLLPSLPDEMANRWKSRRVIHSLEVVVATQSAQPDVLLSYEEAVPVLLALDRAARAQSLALKLAPDSGPPPCVFPARQRPAHLYSLTPGLKSSVRFEHVAACETCVAADRCGGVDPVYTARFGLPAMQPIHEDRVRRRLSLIHHVDEQVRRELTTSNRAVTPEGRAIVEEIVRVNFQCNQSCRFCFVSTHLPTAHKDMIRNAIETAGKRGASIVLSGGEPTLNPKLVEYVRLARSVSSEIIQLQTNAVLLDDASKVQALAQAGVDVAFVSLHGAHAETSDAITDAPGTFARTLVGLDNLTASTLRVVINFVVCGSNANELPEFVDLVASRWRRAVINISFVAPSTDVVPRDREMIPAYSSVMPLLLEAVQRAERHGIQVVGFESMCGIPLCLVPGDLARYLSLDQVPPGYDGGEFFHPEACASCALKERCYGVRTGYAALYGTHEITPVHVRT